jgi:hypothetical protein
VAAGAVAVVLAIGRPFVCLNYLQGDAPGRLAVTGQAATATTTGGGMSLDGTWTVGSGSQAGYRVQEVLFGPVTTGDSGEIEFLLAFTRG